MTKLPISIPEGYKVTVRKGDRVDKGEVIAKGSEDQTSSKEVNIDLTAIFNEAPNKIRKYLLKGPGDRLADGEVIASRGRTLGMKRDQVISHVTGTILRLDRGEGKLVIRPDESEFSEQSESSLPDILSPLSGMVTDCTADSVVIDSEKNVEDQREDGHEVRVSQKQSLGEGMVSGQLMTLAPSGSAEFITSSQIDKGMIGKVLLLPNLEKDAIAKASAIGVVGILGTELSKDLFSYTKDRKIELPLININQDEGKELVKSKKEVVINLKTNSIVHEDKK